MRRTPPTISAAVLRALGILEALGDRPDGLTHSQLCRKVGIPKSTASYLLRTLERRGYLRREAESGRYRLGLRLLALNRAVLAGLDLRDTARPFLRELTERARLTAHLAILDRGQAIYVEKVEVPGFVKIDTWVGRRMEVHCTSVGKALVAHLPEEEVTAILREHGLRARTSRTITRHADFWRELARIRARGFAVDDEENNPGVRCVAAPVFNGEGRVEASIGVTATTSQLRRENLPRVAQLVMEAARKISIQLGYVRTIRPRRPGAAPPRETDSPPRPAR